MIPALVLTAGLATRLRPLSLVRAKAAMPVAGEPLVRRILRQLRMADVADAVLNLHYLPHTITQVVGEGADLGIRVRYSWEVPVLGSAGGPRLALSLMGSSPFLIVNGDTLTNIDVGKLITAHRHSDALVTMAVVPRTEPERYGGIRTDDDGNYTGVTKRGVDDDSFHFVGVQVAEPEAFAALPAGKSVESVSDLYLRLAREVRGSVRVHICEGEFFDIGTPGDYLRTSLTISARDGRANGHGARVRVDPSAHVHESILWDDVRVEAGARLERCVVTDGVTVPAGTTWSACSLRRADGELSPGERSVGDLAVAAIK
jgi:NDP-sugar pyrophosphorylase family protein